MKANRQYLTLAMADACLTPAELALKAQMPRPTLNNVITGRSVRPATLGRVAKALGVPVAALLDETPVSPPAGGD